ncbi:hypothetical protein ACFLV7_12810 [Chloroflexota bacterium]
MIKKIFLGALFLGLAGVLIFGAVNRTIAKSTETPLAKGEGGGRQWEGSIDTEHQGGYGHGQFESNVVSGSHETNDHEGDCSGDSSESQGPSNEQGGSWGGQRRGGGSRNSGGSIAGHSEAETASWITVEGSVLSADAEALVVSTADGETIVIEGRAWRFAQELGYTARVNAPITVVGFYEDGEFKVVQISGNNSEVPLQLRELSGRPLWAGGSQQGGNY